MTKLFLGLAGGFISGIAITMLIYGLKSAKATLKIDHSDPEKDKYLFDVYDLASLSKKKYIVMKIDNHADLS